MTILEFANRLNGREIGQEFTKEDEALAEEHGFGVVYGYDIQDDCSVRFGGTKEAVEYPPNLKHFEGITFYEDANGWFIRALYWFGAYLWTFKTNIPHITFDVFKDGEKHSEGIVFDLTYLKKTPEGVYGVSLKLRWEAASKTWGFANQLNSREVSSKLTQDEEALAVSLGCAVFFNDADGHIKVFNPINGSASYYDPVCDGSEYEFCSNGWFVNADCQHGVYTFKTNAPHAAFDVFKNGKKHSEGFVLDLNYLKETPGPAVEPEKISIPFCHYFLIYDFDHYFESDNAVSVKDFLIQFLDYTGNNRPLIIKALNGMTTDQEMIELINMVTDNNIQKVLEIKQTVYSSGGE